MTSKYCIIILSLLTEYSNRKGEGIMRKIKLGVAFISSFLLLFTFGFINSAKAQENDLIDQEQLNAVESALDEIIVKVNEQIEEGKRDISETSYVPEVNNFVSIKFSVGEVPKSNELMRAAAASGKQTFRAEINGVSFTHTLIGDFTYSSGKLTAVSKDNTQASGFLFSHDKSESVSKLDPSLWQIKSTVAHKYLGVVGGLTGTGYTSYIVMNLYGSGDARLERANYNSGV